MPRTDLVVSGAVALLLAASGLRAQEPDTLRTDTVPRPNYEIQGLTVSVPRAASTTGGSSAVEITLDSMRHIPAPTMEQVLREMPLLVIRQNSRGQAQPALRGSEDRQIAILMDGIPLTLGWDHRTDLSIVPLTAAREITLIRGLSSVLHGPNVLGGVVEVDVARGAERQAAPNPLSVNLSGDHVGGRALAVTGGKLVDSGRGEWVLRAGAGYQETPGDVLPDDIDADRGSREIFTADGDLRRNSDTERYDGFVSARYLRDTGVWLSFSSSAFTTERGVPPEAHVDDPRLWRYPEQDRLIAAFSGGTGQRATAWGEGDIEVSLGVDVGTTEIDQFASLAFDEITGGETGEDRTLTARLLADHTLGPRGELRLALTYADVSHDEILDQTDFNSFRQRLWSGGAEAEFRFDDFFGIPGLTDTRVSVGGALDGADTPESGDKPPLGTLWDWGTRVGFSTLAADGGVMIHGGVSRRTRFPALRELYSGALGRFVPNPDLSPEVLTGGELGFTVASDDVEVQLVGFHQRLGDGIIRTSVVTEQGERKFMRVNRDEIRSTGIELLARGTVGRLTLNGDVTLQDVKGFTGEDVEVELEYEPTYVGKAGASVPLPLRTVGTAGIRFIGDQLCENPEFGGLEPFETDPSVDLSLRRRFRVRNGMLSRLEAVFAVDNVGDAAVFDQCGLPQGGRTFRLQLRLF